VRRDGRALGFDARNKGGQTPEGSAMIPGIEACDLEARSAVLVN
jgi:hypothetical protein